MVCEAGTIMGAAASLKHFVEKHLGLPLILWPEPPGPLDSQHHKIRCHGGTLRTFLPLAGKASRLGQIGIFQLVNMDHCLAPAPK